jgi:plastocyanin
VTLGRSGPAHLLAGLILVAGLALTGCSQSGSANASPVATTSVNLPPSYKFVPAAIVVHAGDKVTWTNNDHFTHSVRLLDNGGQIMVMQPGQSVSFAFTKKGLHHYDCSFHPQNMMGTVLVQ